MKVDTIGITYSKNIKIGESLIAVGAVTTIVGLLFLRKTSQWCILNSGEAIDEALNIYKKHI